MATGEFIGSSRFRVRRRIGSGAFGVVYEANDEARNATVAVKALRHATPDGLYRFKREFRSLSDISHRNLVQLYELIADGDEWLVSMELIRGSNFLTYVWGDHPLDLVLVDEPTEKGFDPEAAQAAARQSRQPLRPTPVDPHRLARALPQLASGMIALHRAGKLHRDIKPSNVLVGHDDRLVLLDFGLVTDTAGDLPFESVSVAGTPAYMSPEQAAGLPLTPASDWYSVGTMLYEALTGDVPFIGSYAQVLTEKQRVEPPPPSAFASGIAEPIDALCRDLLRRDPQQRPSADQILARLGLAAATARIAPAENAAAAPFVGRDRHLRQLRNAFDAMAAGKQTTICLAGPSGIGKTSLLRRFLEQLRSEHPEVLVLYGRCYQRESVPYKGVDSLVDALHRHLSRLAPIELEALVPRDIGAAEQLFPVLHEIGDAVRARRRVNVVPDQQELRRRAFTAIRELFLRLCDRAPLVIAIDDLQWGDADSAELLKEILRPPDAPALLFIGAYRSDEAQSSPFIRPFVGDRSSGIEIRELDIAALTAEESRELATTLLRQVSAASADLALTISDESGGSPFFIDELVRAVGMADQNAILNPAARRGPSDSDAREITIRDLLALRLARLDSGSRQLLELIAVSGRPVPLPVLREAHPAPGLDAALAALRTQHLIRTRDSGGREEVEIYHDRLRDAVVAFLDQDEQSRLHHKLAIALESSEGADAELLADHFLSAGVFDRAADYAIEAADAAASALAFDRAARLYRRAIELTGDAALRRKLGDVLAQGGHGRAAAEEYLAIHPRDFADGLELRRKAAQQLLFSGHVDQGLAVVRTILASMGEPLPETRRETLRALLVARARVYLRGITFRERREADIAPDVLVRVDTCRSVALGLSTVDTMRGAVFQTRYLLLSLDAGEPHRIAHALAMECGYSAVGGTRTRRRTERLTRQMRSIADRLGTPFAAAWADVAAGIGAALQGQWRLGAELLAQAEQELIEHCTGVVWELDTTRLFALRCRTFAGDIRIMSSRFATLLRHAQERGDRYFATSIVLFAYYAYLVADEPQKAAEEIESAIHGWSHAGFHVQHVWHLRAGVEIALYQDQPMLAWTKVAQSWSAAMASLVSRVQFTRLMLEDMRGRAALAAAMASAGRERDRLIGIASHAVKRMRRERADWGTALAEVLRAGIASTRGDAREELERLRLADAMLHRLDMQMHLAAVRRRIGALTGDEEMAARATQWMTGEGIVRPEAISRMLLPWCQEG